MLLVALHHRYSPARLGRTWVSFTGHSSNDFFLWLFMSQEFGSPSKLFSCLLTRYDLKAVNEGKGISIHHCALTLGQWRSLLFTSALWYSGSGDLFYSPVCFDTTAVKRELHFTSYAVNSSQASVGT